MKTYEVLIAGRWERVQGRVFRRWLDWKAADGSNGLARPGKWREIKPKGGKATDSGPALKCGSAAGSKA